MILIKLLVILVQAIIVLGGSLKKMSSKGLNPYTSNKGEKSFYSFQFLPENRIEKNGMIEVIFPLDFEALAFPNSLECRIQSNQNAPFELVECAMQSTRVIRIQMNEVPISLVSVIIGEITNPRFTDTSSQFKIRSYRNDVLIDSNDVFGFISFSEKPGQLQNPNIFKLSNSRIREGSSWEFHFTPQKKYSAGNSLRFTFPEGYTSKQALCDVQNLSGENPESILLFNQRIVTCQNVNMAMSGPQVVKIINMVNPNFSGIMQGFKIEILEGSSSVVLESVAFPGNIEIQPGPLKASYVSDDQFKWSTTTYSFFVNLINPVYHGDRLYFNFTNDWFITQPNCTIINGFTAPFGQQVRCSRIPDQNAYMIDNFVQIDNTKRLVFSVLLESPHVENQYPVTISTYNTNRSAIVDFNSIMININSTYGIIQRFAAHALKSPQTSKAGENGALEMTFFLKTQLPKTDVDSQGHFRVDIFPKIPVPDAIYGVLKCFFYGDVPSYNDCKNDYKVDKPERTYIHILTPNLRPFKESEVPIGVTTISPIGNNKAGIKLDGLVQRYKIHINIWKEQNKDLFLTPDTPPDEVFFTEFIPESIKLTNPATVTVTPTITNADAFTYFEVKYIHVDDFISIYPEKAASERNYVIRIHFMNGFASDLGWGSYLTNPTDKTVREFPCYLSGKLINDANPTNTGTGYSNCEIVFKDAANTYIQVNNIPTANFLAGRDITIGIPKIKISNLIGTKAVISFRLVEETPRCWDQIVTLYQKENIEIFTVTSPYTTVGSGLTITPVDGVRLNLNSQYKFDITQSGTSTKSIIEWPQELKLDFGQVTCTGGTCIKFNGPVYWILFTPSTPQTGGTLTFTMPLGTTTNYKNKENITFRAQTWVGDSIKQIHSKVYQYVPVTMATTKFSCSDPTDYKFQAYQQKQEIEFTLEEPMEDNWYVELVLVSNMKFYQTENFYFKSVNLVALDGQGILTEMISDTKFWIYNLQNINKGVKITITISITMDNAPVTFTPKVTVTTYHQYARGTTADKSVNTATISHVDGSITLTELGMAKFTAMNPISFRYEPIQNSIGPFNFKIKFSGSDIQPSDASLNTYSLVFKFQLNDGSQDGFDVINATEVFRCTINDGTNTYFHQCSASKDATKKQLLIELQPYTTLYQTQFYSFEISSDETQPINSYYGLKFPTKGGYYGFEIWVRKKTVANVKTDQLAYAEPLFIRPPEFKDISITLAHRTPNVKNVFTFDMTVKDAIPAYQSGGRIRIYFPGYQNGMQMFDTNLNHDPVLYNAGCRFETGFVVEAGKKLKCSLGRVNSDGEWNSPFVELMFFQAISANTRLVMQVGNVANPPSATKVGLFKIHTYKWDDTSTTNNIINHMTESVVFDLSGTPATTTNAVNVKFEAGKKINSSQTFLDHKFKINVNLKKDDLLITEMPFPLRFTVVDTANKNNILTCDTSIYQYCQSFDEGNFIVWKLKNDVAANTQIDATIDITGLPNYAESLDTTFYSYVVSASTSKVTYKITETIKDTDWATIVDGITVNVVTFNSNNYFGGCIWQRYIIDLTFTNVIPAGGSILITPTSGISTSDLTPKCMMEENTGYLTFNDVNKYGGLLGCSIKNNGWYIESMNQIVAGSKMRIEAYSEYSSNPGSVSFSVETFANTDIIIATTGKKLDKGTVTKNSSSSNNSCSNNDASTLNNSELNNDNIIPYKNQETLWNLIVKPQSTIDKLDIVVFELVNHPSGSDFYPGTQVTTYQWFYQPADFIVSGSPIGGACMFYVPSSKAYDTAQRVVCTNFDTAISSSDTLTIYFRMKNPNFSGGVSIQQDFIFYSYQRTDRFNRYNVFESSWYGDGIDTYVTAFTSTAIAAARKINRSSSNLSAPTIDLTPTDSQQKYSCDMSEYAAIPTRLYTCQLFSGDIVVAFTTLYDDFTATKLSQTLKKTSGGTVGLYHSLKGCGAVVGYLNTNLKVTETLVFDKVINNPDLYYFSSELKCILTFYKKFTDATFAPGVILATDSTSCTVGGVSGGSTLTGSIQSGYINNESRLVGKVAFKLLRPNPLYSRIYLTFTSSTSSKTQLQFANKVNVSGATSDHSPLILVPISGSQYELIGLPLISASTDIVVYFGIKQLSTSNINMRFISIHPNGRTIEGDKTYTISQTGVSGFASTGYKELYRMKRYMKDSNQKGPLQFLFKLRNFDITSADKLTVSIPTSFTISALSSGGKQLSDYQNYPPVNEYNYWLHGTPTSLSTSPVDITVGSFSTVQQFTNNKDYHLLLTTRYGDTYDGFQYPSNIGYYRFALKGYKAGVAKEYGYDLLAIEAEGDEKLQVTALNTNIGHDTVINFKWQITVAAVSGDELWLEFQTNNGRPPLGINYDKGFDNLLGYTNIHQQFECIEATNNVITTTNVLTCELFRKGDATQNPAEGKEEMTGIRIPITKAIAANTDVEFYISGIKNPIYSNRDVRVTISLRKTITGFEDNPKLAYQKSHGKYVTTNGNIPIQIFNNAPTVGNPPKATTFSATKTVHTGGFYPPFASETHTWNIVSTQNVQNKDWIRVYYTLANNPNMGTTCKPLTDVAPKCVFPKTGFVVAQYTGTSASIGILSVTGMQNGIYRYAGQYTVEHWDGGDGSTITAFKVGGIVYEWDEDPAFKLEFQPYMTPVEQQYRNTYWLTDFMNVVQVNITGIWKYNNIKSFWLDVPLEITRTDLSFCNATQITPTLKMNPYPWRFNCRVINQHRVVFEITDDFLAWVEADNRNNQIYLTFKFWIDEFVKDGPTSDFVLSTYHMPYYEYEQNAATVTIDNYGVTRTRGNINISPYIQPDLRVVTFNSLRFYERKAKIRDKVEIYMLLQPKTALSLHRVEHIVFRLPEEFKYAPIRFFDACDVQGKFNTPVLSCELMRVHGQTFVNMTFYPNDSTSPNYNPTKSAYDNTVKIIRISAKSNNDLFTSPELPGEIYNITASLYSRGTVIEKQTKNVTKIIGYDLMRVDAADKILTSFEPVADSLQLGLFQMRLVLDNYGVIAGYDSFATKMYSQIVFIFDNVDYGYPFDLGTGLKNHEELGCVGTGLTTLRTKKLTCILTYGFNQENLPYITVSGYDPIPPKTDVRVYITQIQAVPELNPLKQDPKNKVPIRGGISYVYKDIGMSAFYYEPFEYQPNQNSQLAAVAGDQASATVTTPGTNNKVLETENYTFSFKTAATIKTTDYFAFQFPDNYFERFSDYSGVTTANFVTKVFGISNMIYLSPNSDISAGSTVTAEIKNLINPAYSQNIPIVIQGFSMIDYKVKETFDFKLTGRTIVPFDKFTRVEAISSTRVGGANGISYKVVFITGHKVPSNGAFSVTMPPQYKFSLYEMQAKCSLIGFDPVVTCMIGSQNRMDVFLNGSIIQVDKEYSIILENINSPNEDVSAYKVTLTSYFSDNIYINQMICRQSVAFPTVIIQDKRSCDLVVETTILNAKALSLYTFMLQCDNTVRPDTDLEIILHEDYKIMNGINKEIECSSNEPQTLRQAKCKLILNSNYQFVLKIAINSIPSQSLFSIKAALINPKQVNKPYTYQANLSSYSILYAQTTLAADNLSRAITFFPESIALSSQMNPNTKKQVSIQNIPRNAGQAATYILTIPPLGQSQLGNSPSEVRITFPQNEFALTIGDNIQCGIYTTQIDDKSFKTYKGLLSLTKASNTDQTKNYKALSCQVVQPYELIIDTSKLSADQMDLDESWQHWIIRNVYNPKQYNQQSQFHIQYISNKQILWNFQDNILYFISSAPSFIKVSDLRTEPSDIRTPSKYTFNLTAEYPIPQNPIVGISVQLPTSLYDTIEYLESSPLEECALSPLDSSLKSPSKQKLSCSVFDQEILIEQANFQSLLGQSTNSIQIEMSKIFNPNLIYTCNSKNPDLNQYTFRFFDWNSGDIFLVSSPSIDTRNCMNFVKNSFDINFEGPLTVQPGLSYTYKLKLEQPANGLTIIPNSPIGGIKFEPQIISLNNYENSDITLLVKIRSDVLPRTYQINFDVNEAPISSSTLSSEEDNSTVKLTSKLSNRSSFYLPIQPLRLNVQENSSDVIPTVTVGDITSISIGYPLRVPVTLSKSPSNILMLIISLKEEQFKQMITINPPILQINPGETSVYFEISINTSKVPSVSATLEFALTSYYTVIHQLTQTTKYISFSINHEYDSDYSALQINLSKYQIPTPDIDLQQTILNKNSKAIQTNSAQTVDDILNELIPKVLLVKTKEVNANNSTISVYASSKAQLYLVLSYQGENAPSSASAIINKNVNQGLQYKEFSVNTIYRNSGAIDHLSEFTLLNLEAQTNYVIHMVMQNAFGFSKIFSYQFKTSRLSFGSIISIPVRDIIPTSDLIKSLSLALRIPENRFISKTNVTHLQEQSENFDKDIMIKREYYYDIVITPDTQNDSTPTSTLATKLQEDPLTRSLMKSLLSSFDLNNPIRQIQIIQGIPTIAEEITPVSINYNNATFSIRLWEQGYVFAIVQEASPHSVKPVSKQIFQGKNHINQQIQSYQRFGQPTDKDGNVIITIDDLIDNRNYILYVTVGNHLPYSTLNLFEDDEVRTYQFSTPFNANIGYDTDRFSNLVKSNPKLAQALIDFES